MPRTKRWQQTAGALSKSYGRLATKRGFWTGFRWLTQSTLPEQCSEIAGLIGKIATMVYNVSGIIGTKLTQKRANSAEIHCTTTIHTARMLSE
jgi:hypothetical protein